MRIIITLLFSVFALSNHVLLTHVSAAPWSKIRERIKGSKPAENILHLEAKDITKLPEMLQHHRIDLKKTAIFFDFDETLASASLNLKDKTFHFSVSPSLSDHPAHGQAFSAVYGPFSSSSEKDRKEMAFLGALKKFKQTHGADFTYQRLEPKLQTMVLTLGNKGGAFLAVCSAKPTDGKRAMFLKSLGLMPGRYFYAPRDKYSAIVGALKTLPKGRSISTIVLVDDTPFNLDQTVEQFEKYFQSRDKVLLPLVASNVRLILVKATRFERSLTPERLIPEYRALKAYF